jgi:hypothetical protein
MIETLKTKQALAEGVLDLRGDLSKLALTSGRQTFLSRLQQLLGPSVAGPGSEAPKLLPADRSLAFAQTVREKLGGALIRCEESYPLEGAHSVLFVVVERDAPLWSERLAPLHQEFFGEGKWDPLAPVKIEVIDRATDEALRRLVEAGLVASSTRAIRSLCLATEDGNGAAALSEEERQKALAHRQQAARKLKMAHLLEGGGLSEEAGEALREATLSVGRALAVENRLPEPGEMKESLRPPLSLIWGDALPTLHELASRPSPPPTRVTEVLQKLLA